MFGQEYEYVKKVYHKCGICQQAMLFDLETLFNHLRGNHQIKVKEYIDLYIGPIGTLQQQIQPKPIILDDDGAPVRKKVPPPKDRPRPGPASSKKNKPGPKSSKRTIPSWTPKEERDYIPEKKTRELSGRTSDPRYFNTGVLVRIQDTADDGCLISNDIADYTCVECQICEAHIPMTRLRTHTKSHHQMTITEYKERFGTELIPVEVVWHRCGVCSDLVMLDSDHIAVHLKRGGHPRITHKDYNDQYMVDTRSSKMADSVKKPRKPRVVDIDDENNEPERKLPKKESRSGGLVITKVPKKEGSQNYISDHEEDEEEEERERSRRTKTKITYEEGDVDILEHAIGEITAPEDKKNSDAKEMKKSDSVSTDSSVVLSDNEDDNDKGNDSNG